MASASRPIAARRSCRRRPRRCVHALGRELQAGQLGKIPAALREGLRAAHPGHHRPQPRGERGAADAQLRVPRRQAVTARRAVVPGAPQGDRSQHRVDALGPVADELGPVPRPALDARAALARVERQQVFEERPTQAQHRGPMASSGVQAVGSSPLPSAPAARAASRSSSAETSARRSAKRPFFRPPPRPGGPRPRAGSPVAPRRSPR